MKALSSLIPRMCALSSRLSILRKPKARSSLTNRKAPFTSPFYFKANGPEGGDHGIEHVSQFVSGRKARYTLML